ncbi:hypothetical protein [Aeromonas dhakensis]|uniref:hypothetical protein n=1 Tax=Aeromonas dhakensis TaxID=196024 RepID=UPI001CF03C6C|nr:hypothetical protein [Aeromonas dhakensis]UCM47138.1 hypothetical protein LEO73_10365 [Aeromonas dhakensis]
MTDQVISKLVNQVSFKIDNKSWKDAQNKIKRLAGMWHKSSQGFSKAMEQGRRASTLQAKATDRQTRTELKAYRNRKTTIKADQIRHGDLIKSNIDFRKQLQKTNWEFLKGSLSAKERAATIGALTKQYRSLNQQASRYNQSSKALGAIKSVRQGVSSVTRLGVAAGAAGVVAGSAITHNQFNKVKGEGQQYEALTIRLMNVFGNRAEEISDIIANMSDKNGRNIIDTGSALVEFVALMQPLGDNVDKAISSFQKYQDALASYGLDKQASQGFMTQWSQALASNTLDSYQEAMRQWAPNFKADFEIWIKTQKGINDFSENITGGKKYNLKKLMDEYLTANTTMYASKAQLYKNSSMAQDERTGNALSLAIYRVFNTSGFSDAMKFANKIVLSWANTLQNNSDKIGQVFSNLYKIASELGDGAFKSLSNWLSELTAQDIRTYFEDAKTSISEFLSAIKALAQFINSILPDYFTQNKQSTSVPESQRKNYDADTYGKVYVQKEKELLNSGLDPSAAARQAEQFALQQALKIPQPTIPQSAISFNAHSSNFNGGGIPSNFSGKLNLKIDAQVNKDEFNNFVDFKIHDNNMMQLNLLAE